MCVCVCETSGVCTDPVVDVMIVARDLIDSVILIL